MVLDATSITHAAGRNDDGPGTNLVKRFGLFNTFREMNIWQIISLRSPHRHFFRLCIEQFHVLPGDAGGFSGHG